MKTKYFWMLAGMIIGGLVTGISIIIKAMIAVFVAGGIIIICIACTYTNKIIKKKKAVKWNKTIQTKHEVFHNDLHSRMVETIRNAEYKEKDCYAALIFTNPLTKEEFNSLDLYLPEIDILLRCLNIENKNYSNEERILWNYNKLRGLSSYFLRKVSEQTEIIMIKRVNPVEKVNKQKENQLSFVWNGERRLTYKELLDYFMDLPEFEDKIEVCKTLISLITESYRDIFPYKKSFCTKLQLDELFGLRYYNEMLKKEMKDVL
jgi:hypothetical protein